MNDELIAEKIKELETALVQSDALDDEYDRKRKELIPPETLSTGFVPEHEETKTSIVPDSWDMRVVLGWKKFGTGVADVIEKSVMKGSPRLSIKAKKKTIEPA